MCLKFMKAVKDTKNSKKIGKLYFVAMTVAIRYDWQQSKIFSDRKQLPTYNRWGVFLYLSYFLN